MGGSARQGGTERGLGVCRVRVKVPYARERDRGTKRERERDREGNVHTARFFLLIYIFAYTLIPLLPIKMIK